MSRLSRLERIRASGRCEPLQSPTPISTVHFCERVLGANIKKSSQCANSRCANAALVATVPLQATGSDLQIPRRPGRFWAGCYWSTSPVCSCSSTGSRLLQVSPAIEQALLTCIFPASQARRSEERQQRTIATSLQNSAIPSSIPHPTIRPLTTSIDTILPRQYLTQHHQDSTPHTMGCATFRPGKAPAPPKSPNPPPLMGSPFDGPSDGTRNKNSRMAKLRIKTSRDGFTPVPLKPM